MKQLDQISIVAVDQFCIVGNKGRVNNPAGYLVANIKRAQEGAFNLTTSYEPIRVTAAQQPIQINSEPIQKALQTDIKAVMAEIRALLSG